MSSEAITLLVLFGETIIYYLVFFVFLTGCHMFLGISSHRDRIFKSRWTFTLPVRFTLGFVVLYVGTWMVLGYNGFPAALLIAADWLLVMIATYLMREPILRGEGISRWERFLYSFRRACVLAALGYGIFLGAWLTSHLAVFAYQSLARSVRHYNLIILPE